MKVDIFSGVGNQIDEVLNRIIENVQSGWVAGLLTTAKVGIALYITIFGYMVLSGKKESPLPDLIWDLCRFAIVLVFLDTASGYLSMMNEAVDGIQGFLTGGTGDNKWSSLDNKLNTIVNLTADLWDKNNGFVAIVLMIFLIPFVLGFGAYSAVLILTTVTLKVLMAAAPLFIFCYMWDFLRETFNNWLSAILGNCLVLLFISLYAQVGFSMAKYAINMQFSNVENIFLVPLSLAIAGILTVYGVREGHSMGMTLARIAVEKAVDGKNGNLNTSNLSMRNLAKTIKGKLTPTTKD